MAKPMHLERQEAYEWPVAVYLFFGGFGGALITLSYILNFFAATASMVGLATLSGLVFFAIAGLFLVFFDLERPLNAIYSMNNATKSGISWDVMLIIVNYVFGILFVIPEFANFSFLSGLSSMLAPYQVFFGAIAAIAGFLFPIISGGLLAAPASIPLWHTPALPVLYLVTSFSLALAYLGTLYAPNGTVYTAFMGAILALSALTFGLSLAYLEHTHNGPIEAKEGMHRMLKTARFVILYPLVGVLFPLGLSAYLFFSGATLTWAMPALAIALFLGGFAARNCVVNNGIETYPWPY
ncbi:NrfD/PsrC family molybdoenzyme membrane anchor subunit [Desulfitobacterium metallireducens]|uniref:Molybdopterin oxidoreductase n=1 Tax=Desulfitobacterium metallireducens DSM 15288 TaxID=871968 RepID=W0E6R8_9FIRM|nr:NrfD/PsrC family molybdoenzyme membrane anchor subunit [Desulfitobacterium metallireducens]AHF06590.1 molybdopterin oxidoreductase [Desulfitobacterium metallireducens DSM 15288]